MAAAASACACVGALSSPASSSSIASTNPRVSSSSSAARVVAARRASSSSSFSQSEFFAKTSLSTAVSAVDGQSRAGSLRWRPLAPVCKISKGDALPAVSLKDQDGKTVTLSKYKGKPLVLYFYPADNTPGCTKQACAFRDAYEKFSKAGAEVVGISGDDPASHRAFKQKFRLPFTLLSDENNKLRKDWGVPGDFFGSLPGRQTYVFDKTGTVQLIFNNQFQPEKHIDETLKVVKGF